MFTLNFETDNSAFDKENLIPECQKILDQVKRILERYSIVANTIHGEMFHYITDSNGNKIGKFQLTY